MTLVEIAIKLLAEQEHKEIISLVLTDDSTDKNIPCAILYKQENAG